MYLKLVLVMIFLHIIEDFKLQGIMAELKQKNFWKNNDGKINKFYKYDYIPVLILHGFQNSFLIHVPIYIYAIYTHINFMYVAISCLIYTCIHACVDHLKCNTYYINLAQDQIIHLIYIMLIAYAFVYR